MFLIAMPPIRSHNNWRSRIKYEAHNIYVHSMTVIDRTMMDVGLMVFFYCKDIYES